MEGIRKEDSTDARSLLSFHLLRGTVELSRTLLHRWLFIVAPGVHHWCISECKVTGSYSDCDEHFDMFVIRAPLIFHSAN